MAGGQKQHMSRRVGRMSPLIPASDQTELTEEDIDTMQCTVQYLSEQQDNQTTRFLAPRNETPPVPMNAQLMWARILFTYHPRWPPFVSNAFVTSRFAAARWVPETKQSIRFSLTVLKNLGIKAGPGSIEEKLRGEASCLRNRLSAYEEMPFYASNDISDAVANVISGMAFGKCYDYGDETFRDLVDVMHKVVDELGPGQIISVFPFLRFVPGINSGFKEVLKQSTKIQHVLWDEITRHRENLDRENPRDFLDFCLLKVEKQEKLEGLTEEIVLAGIDKTTNTLLYTVHEELDAVAGEGLPSLSHRSQLPYVNACLLEVMMIRTTVPLSIPHATTETVKMQGCDIPKGTQILLNLYSVHMDPAYWPDPDRFDPGRERQRACLGEQLARMELFLFFSTLLQSFTFRTPEGASLPTTAGVFSLGLKPRQFKLCAIPR
ncbi:cytochrome P450 2 sub U member 1 [Branchiostoma belcheri]|nr:cytochrome P450 2 sub U member 1 [Branchiostoma belcheri]